MEPGFSNRKWSKAGGKFKSTPDFRSDWMKSGARVTGSDTVIENASGTAIVFGATGDVIENSYAQPFMTLSSGVNPTIFSLGGGSALLYAGRTTRWWGTPERRSRWALWTTISCWARATTRST